MSPPLPAAARMRVTSVARPGEWIRIAWSPDRPGNWLFHCHLLTHMTGAQRLDRMADPRASGSASHLAAESSRDHAIHDMGGLVMALEVRPARGVAASAPPAMPGRSLDLYADARPGRFGDEPGYGFVLQRGPVAPAGPSAPCGP